MGWVPSRGFFLYIICIAIIFSLSVVGFFAAPWIYVLGVKKNKKWIRYTSILIYVFGIIGSFILCNKIYETYHSEQLSQAEEKRRDEENAAQQLNQYEKKVEEYRTKTKLAEENLANALEEKSKIKKEIEKEMNDKLADSNLNLRAAQQLYHESYHNEKKLKEENERLLLQIQNLKSATNPQQNP